MYFCFLSDLSFPYVLSVPGLDLLSCFCQLILFTAWDKPPFFHFTTSQNSTQILHLLFFVNLFFSSCILQFLLPTTIMLVLCGFSLHPALGIITVCGNTVARECVLTAPTYTDMIDSASAHMSMTGPLNECDI